MHSWFSHEEKRDVRGSMGTRKHRHKYLPRSSHRVEHPKPPSRPKKCRAFCCGSTQLSVSSSADDARSSSCVANEATIDPTSSLAHAMVQQRLEQMIKGKRTMAAGAAGSSGRCVVLVALSKDSHEPLEDFRESMLEVITSNGLEEPRELRKLLSCYMSMNARENRVVILEAFHEVCTSLFTCKCY